MIIHVRENKKNFKQRAQRTTLTLDSPRHNTHTHIFLFKCSVVVVAEQTEHFRYVCAMCVLT